MGISVIPSLARNVPYGNIDNIIAGWKLSNDDAANLRFVADWLQETRDRGYNMTEAEAKGCIAVHNTPKKWIIDYFEAVNDPDNVIAVIKQWTVPKFPVNGNDIINAGVKPGKAIGEVLEMGRICWSIGFKIDSGYVEPFVGTKDQIMEVLASLIERKIND